MLNDKSFGKRAELMTDAAAENMYEAAMDVVSLVDTADMHPTQAAAKIASIAKMTPDQLKLLTYAYNNMGSAMQRTKTGGVFERLGEYSLVNYDEAYKLVFGQPEAKTASFLADVFPSDLFEYDMSDLSPADRDKLLGISNELAEIAEPDKPDGDEGDEGHNEPDGDEGHGRHKGSCLRISIECGGNMADKLPKEILNMLPAEIVKLIGAKKEAHITACATADESYTLAGLALESLARQFNSDRYTSEYKAAGLASITHAYPEIGSLLLPLISEVPSKLIKAAGFKLGPLDIESNHPLVIEAGKLVAQLEKAAELTAEANLAGIEYQEAIKLMPDTINTRKAALFDVLGSSELQVESKEAAFNPLVLMANTASRGAASFGANVAAKNMKSIGFGDSPEDILDRAYAQMDDKTHEADLRDIRVQSMLNDFSSNDEILREKPLEELVLTYNELYRMAPTLMRDPTQARALMRQYVTQGNMAPSEFVPVLSMNKSINQPRSLKDYA